MAARIQIGVISDTHGLLRPETVRALHGVDQIIHAGDIGTPDVLDGLRRIAPVVAVRGNTDYGLWAQALTMTAVVPAGDCLVYVLHDLGALDLDPVAAGMHVVISGHSHHPDKHAKDGVLYLNPGSAGPKRFKLAVALAILRIDGDAVHTRHVDLDS